MTHSFFVDVIFANDRVTVTAFEDQTRVSVGSQTYYLNAGDAVAVHPATRGEGISATNVIFATACFDDYRWTRGVTLVPLDY